MMKTNIGKHRHLVVLFGSLLLILSFYFNDASDNVNSKARFNPFSQRVDTPDLRVHGVKIFVKDLIAAEGFYHSFLGLDIEQKTDVSIKLNTGQYPLYLIKTERHVPRKVITESHYGISFLTSKLMPAIDSARESGVLLFDTLLSRNGIGIHIPMVDPSGNLLHLMEVQLRKIPYFDGFRLYNSGTTTDDMSSAEEFYIQKLGFKDWSRDYLPDALPLKDANGAFAFMLHQDENLKRSSYVYGTSPGVVLILEADELERVALYLGSKNIDYETKDEMILVSDNHNNVIEIIDSP